MRRGTRAGVAAVLGGTCVLAVAGATAAAQLLPDEPQPESRAALARIAFVADGGLHTVAADGSGRERLTTRGRGVVDEEPAWSPDGSTIAFTRLNYRTGGALIWLVNRDGTGLRQLTPGVSPGTEQSSPTWSPDGKRIAFVRTREQGSDEVALLLSIASDGSDERIVHSETTPIETSAYFREPAWSPSGEQILFTREVSGGRVGDDLRPQLRVVPATGGQARRIVTNGTKGAWSPGGDRIAYTAVYDGDRPCSGFCSGTGEIFVANADGSGRTRLTTSRAEDGSPSWSGDGGRIAFHSDRNSTEAESEDAPPELYSIRPDGTCLTWLTNGTAHSEWPDFERAAGLSSDPGGCGGIPREPLVETSTVMAEEVERFPVWWLGRVAPNGLLLSDVEVTTRGVWFGYHDCGRFDPKECGDFVNVTTTDLCARGRQLATAGRPGTTLSLVRGALLSETRSDESGRSVLFTHRSRVLTDTASGFPIDRALIAGLRRLPQQEPPAGNFPSTRLPVSLWRELRTTRDVSPREVRRRRAVARRLAQLGVTRRLSCSR